MDPTKIKEVFNEWLEVEALKEKSLWGWIKQAKSSIGIVAWLAIAVLFVFFTVATLKAAIADSKAIRLASNRDTKKTTDDITREVLRKIERPSIDTGSPAALSTAQTVTKEETLLKGGSEQEPSAIEEGTRGLEIESQRKTESSREVEPLPSTKPQVDRSNPQIAEVFLGAMMDETEGRKKSFERQEKDLRTKKQVVFWAFIVAATVTAMLAVTGVILIFVQQLTFGVVVEAVGIFPGAGTVILRRLSKQITADAREAQKLRDDSLALLQAIHAVFLIADVNKRSDAMVSLVSRLTDRALKSA